MLFSESVFTRVSRVLVYGPWIAPPLVLFAYLDHGISRVNLVSLSVGYVVTVLGIEVGFHRLFSHGSFRAHPIAKTFLAIAGSMAAEGPVVYWLATHLRHHAHSDEEGDPHSPHLSGAGLGGRLRGLWHAHHGWVSGVDLHASYDFVPHRITRDRFLRTMNSLFFLWVALGLVLPALVSFAFDRSLRGFVDGLLVGGLFRIWLVQQCTFSVNSICHTFGSRSEKGKDLSTNNAWLALPTLGGSWHRNHHARPAYATTWFRPWQIDLSYVFILALTAVGLVRDARTPWGKKDPS